MRPAGINDLKNMVQSLDSNGVDESIEPGELQSLHHWHNALESPEGVMDLMILMSAVGLESFKNLKTL